MGISLNLPDHNVSKDMKDDLLRIIKDTLKRDERVIFAYLYGSFVKGGPFRDVDIAIYIKPEIFNPFEISSDLKVTMAEKTRGEGFPYGADFFDVKVINEAPFTILGKIFSEGVLLLDRYPELRTDLIEEVSFKYRECAGTLLETLRT